MARIRPGAGGERPAAAPIPPRRVGRWLSLLTVGVWVVLLRGFVSPLPLVILSLSGPLAIWMGLRLAVRMGRQLFSSGWSVAGLVLGLGLVGAGLATLVAGAPDRLLVGAAGGWELLNRRVTRLGDAVRANDVSLAHRLLQRGVGDSAPLDELGRPWIHRVEHPEMLAAFLEHGLDPDAPDDDDQTRLMLVRQPELARLLLAAGADVHARDRFGRAVVDHHDPYGPVRPVLDEHAGEALRNDASGPAAMVDARTDWVRRDVAATPRSAVPGASIAPAAPARGDEATVTLTLVNPSDADQHLDVRAELNQALLFVSASAGGLITRPRRPQFDQRLHWPRLLLPAHAEGQLDVRVVRRADAEAGDPVARWEVRLEPGGTIERYEVAPPRDQRRTASAEAGWPWPQVIWFAVLVSLALLARAWMRRQRDAAKGGVTGVGRVAAAGGAVVTTGIAVALSWSAVEPYVRFAPATCTILDRRVYSREIRSSDARGQGSSAPTRTYPVPVAAVRIETGGAARVATGFTTGWATYSSEELRPFALGARVPCWVDPAESSRFTLVRRPPLSLAVGLTMLAIVTLALAAIARLLGPSTPRPRGRHLRAR